MTVRGVEDEDTNNETVTVSHRSSGGGYGSVSGTVTVTVTDDDTQAPGLVFSPRQLSVGEGDTATYRLSLATRPTGAVTVTVSSGDTAALAVPVSFVFTTSELEPAAYRDGARRRGRRHQRRDGDRHPPTRPVVVTGR